MARSIVRLTERQVERAKAFADEFRHKYLDTDHGRAQEARLRGGRE